MYTNRLILRPVCPEDIDCFSVLLSDAETTRYLPDGKPYSEERIRQYLSNRIAHWKKGFGTYSLFLKDKPNTPIGYAGVEFIADSPGCVDIRYAVLPSMAGKGYAFEAAQAVISETFANTEIAVIYGVAVSENIASIRILEKLGMQTEPTLQLYDAEGLRIFSLCRNG